LTLEVTEDVFVRDGERALVVLNDLKAMGVTIALDDFGTEPRQPDDRHRSRPARPRPRHDRRLRGRGDDRATR
jgi:EAL domain-containing protein (putative c-di-GMP-specific phosphodiesterase class I)